MQNLEARVSKLEKQISTLIRNMSNGKKYMENDIEAGKENTAKAQQAADDANELGRENSEDLQEVSDGLMETFEGTIRNANSVEELQDATIELYEIISAKEV